MQKWIWIAAVFGLSGWIIKLVWGLIDANGNPGLRGLGWLLTGIVVAGYACFLWLVITSKETTTSGEDA